MFAGSGKVVLAGLGEQQCFRTRGRDQRPEGIAGQVGVVQITGHGGGIGGRRTELQLREKESPVGVVAATVDSCQQALADIVTQRFVRRVGHIGHHAVKGVFERGVLALVGRDEHGGDHLDTLASGGGQFAHHLVENLGIGCGKLCESVGDDGFRRALAGIRLLGGGSCGQ